MSLEHIEIKDVKRRENDYVVETEERRTSYYPESFMDYVKLEAGDTAKINLHSKKNNFELFSLDINGQEMIMAVRNDRLEVWALEGDKE